MNWQALLEMAPSHHMTIFLSTQYHFNSNFQIILLFLQFATHFSLTQLSCVKVWQWMSSGSCSFMLTECEEVFSCRLFDHMQLSKTVVLLPPQRTTRIGLLHTVTKTCRTVSSCSVWPVRWWSRTSWWILLLSHPADKRNNTSDKLLANSLRHCSVQKVMHLCLLYFLSTALRFLCELWRHWVVRVTGCIRLCCIGLNSNSALLMFVWLILSVTWFLF